MLKFAMENMEDTSTVGEAYEGNPFSFEAISLGQDFWQINGSFYVGRIEPGEVLLESDRKGNVVNGGEKLVIRCDGNGNYTFASGTVPQLSVYEFY